MSIFNTIIKFAVIFIVVVLPCIVQGLPPGRSHTARRSKYSNGEILKSFNTVIAIMKTATKHKSVENPEEQDALLEISKIIEESSVGDEEAVISAANKMLDVIGEMKEERGCVLKLLKYVIEDVEGNLSMVFQP